MPDLKGPSRSKPGYIVNRGMFLISRSGHSSARELHFEADNASELQNYRPRLARSKVGQDYFCHMPKVGMP